MSKLSIPIRHGGRGFSGLRNSAGSQKLSNIQKLTVLASRCLDGKLPQIEYAGYSRIGTAVTDGDSEYFFVQWISHEVTVRLPCLECQHLPENLAA